MRLSGAILPAWSNTESVIQDVAIPVGNAVAFLDFLLSRIPITPIWICPFRASAESKSYPLYPVEPGLYINFGFWDVVAGAPQPGWYNRQVEAAAQALGGRKGLYSSSFYDAGAFRALYDHRQYEAMKKKYDPEGLFGDLYDKCVRAL
jgi:FAD/FMN-containing dehydrogenase